MRTKALLLFLCIALAAGCAEVPASKEFSWELYRAPSISASAFTGKTIAILPVVSIEYDSTQEIYKEALGGLIFASLRKYSNDVTLLSVSVTQGLVNSAGLWSDMQAMYKEYQTTSILRKDTLEKIGKALGARYALLPKVLRFAQESFDRVNLFGISFLRTRQSTLDIHIQLWDTETGEVVWQGIGEGSEAAEAVEGRPVSFMTVAQFACESLSTRLPWVVEKESEKKPKKKVAPESPYPFFLEIEQ